MWARSEGVLTNRERKARMKKKRREKEGGRERELSLLFNHSCLAVTRGGGCDWNISFPVNTCSLMMTDGPAIAYRSGIAWDRIAWELVTIPWNTLSLNTIEWN